MTQLTDEERQMLLTLIDAQFCKLAGRQASRNYARLKTLRRKLEGTDKRVIVEDR